MRTLLLLCPTDLSERWSAPLIASGVEVLLFAKTEQTQQFFDETIGPGFLDVAKSFKGDFGGIVTDRTSFVWVGISNSCKRSADIVIPADNHLAHVSLKSPRLLFRTRQEKAFFSMVLECLIKQGMIKTDRRALRRPKAVS